MFTKYFKLEKYDLWAAGLICFAALLRLMLIANNWPMTNSDEGTMGVMALHIAYKNEQPLIYYGQLYMGVLEAYLGAFFFHLFGTPSLFALRLGVILFVTLFFICIYLLSSLLYSKQLGLVTLAVLSIGSAPFFTRQTIATGGSSQTLFFGSLAFLLTVTLAITYHKGLPFKIRLLRFAGYTLFGLVLGLGLWSDMVVIPIFAVALLIPLLFCWRELLWSWIGVLIGGGIGLLPVIAFSSMVGSNPLQVLLSEFDNRGTAPHTLPGILHGIVSTILVSIPTATGEPFCPVQEIRFLGPTSPHTPLCTMIHATWGFGYVALLAIALGLILWHIFLYIKKKEGNLSVSRAKLVQEISRLLLLGGGVLAISVYAISSAGVTMPGFHARYLITLLIVTPAIIAPVWNAAQSKLTSPGKTWFPRLTILSSRFVLAVVALTLLTGTVLTFGEIPQAQAEHAKQRDVLDHLLSLHITHVYTDYWVCNNLAFASREEVICSVIESHLVETHNRVPGYAYQVRTYPRKAYLFPPDTGQLPAVEQYVQSHKLLFKRYTFDGFVLIDVSPNG